MRIILVPQYPTPIRYQEWWFTELPKQFQRLGHEVIVLGKHYYHIMEHDRGVLSNFSPINKAIDLESIQIEEYLSLEIKSDDVLFVADLSFPGIFCNVLFHKKCPKMFAFCHATSINKYDYFSKDREYKFPIELAHSQMFDKVFVGSFYHQDKLKMKNTVVTYLPFPPMKFDTVNTKEYNIMSASRPNPQKVDIHLEAAVESKYGEIVRPISYSWNQYFNNLQKSRVLLITSFEDTFGYQIVDAVINGCIPIARNSLAYPELLPKEYLYDTKDELFDLIDKALDGSLEVPKLICEDKMNNFYNKIVYEMTKENRNL